MNPLKVVWFDIETVLEYVWLKVELHTPYVDLLAIPTHVYGPDFFIFVVCFTVGELVRQNVCMVSRLFLLCLVKVMVR